MSNLIQPKRDLKGIVLVWVVFAIAFILFNFLASYLSLNRMTITIVDAGFVLFAILYYYVQKGVDKVM